MGPDRGVEGRLGIWGGVAAGALVGIWRLRRRAANVALFMDAVAPSLLVAQAIGTSATASTRNCRLPSKLPWALEIGSAHRQLLPLAYRHYTTFQPTG